MNCFEIAIFAVASAFGGAGFILISGSAEFPAKLPIYRLGLVGNEGIQLYKGHRLTGGW